MNKNSALMIMHLNVFIYGFTGIIGKLVNLQAEELVWIRVIIASFISYLLLKFKHVPLNFNFRSDLLHFLIISIFLAAHWYYFFHAIRVSNISIALIGFAINPVFTAILEPIFHKEKFDRLDLIGAILSFIGIYIIFNSIESDKDLIIGFIYGLLSGLLATLFTMYNRSMIKKYNALKISFIQLFFASICLSFFIRDFSGIKALETIDWFYLFLLGSVCTSFAHTLSIKVMKVIKAYDVALITNLEPVYSIILAVIIFTETEKMTINFYIGSIFVLIAVFLKPLLVKYLFRKKV
jgi:drug/metabolite transporter (DMT)-like permease